MKIEKSNRQLFATFSYRFESPPKGDMKFTS